MHLSQTSINSMIMFKMNMSLYFAEFAQLRSLAISIYMSMKSHTVLMKVDAQELMRKVIDGHITFP